jgi:hypothetical protein
LARLMQSIVDLHTYRKIRSPGRPLRLNSGGLGVRDRPHNTTIASHKGAKDRSFISRRTVSNSDRRLRRTLEEIKHIRAVVITFKRPPPVDGGRTAKEADIRTCDAGWRDGRHGLLIAGRCKRARAIAPGPRASDPSPTGTQCVSYFGY